MGETTHDAETVDAVLDTFRFGSWWDDSLDARANDRRAAIAVLDALAARGLLRTGPRFSESERAALLLIWNWMYARQPNNETLNRAVATLRAMLDADGGR